ncbi:dihydropteroate synthase [Aureimonas sp. Leaf454]|uniref:dihydropteroate synthase n=1 Tax=Aureimonas sp. Leaf454 TaxID=1736381 RepID=UPI0006F8F10E|nr:dihydropteroate synthase [Aureimonas sp. Leaf454]KQT53266.1 dihydropteroate synthase [Aureimonas sp. Leaf454]
MKPLFPRARNVEIGHGQRLTLGRRSTLMGILNVTPDSFSDGGRHATVDRAVAAALRMVDEGADIIDIGGESTRPGATPVDAIEEQRRVLPVIEALCRHPGLVLSIDTYRSETARLAVEAGVHIVNDVFGAQKDHEIAKVAAETGSGLCLMHTGRERQPLPDVIEDQFLFLRRSLEIATIAGVERNRIILDPGFGFAKDGPQNMRLMARFDELLALDHPILVGTSRKRFVLGSLGRDDPERDVATAATSVLLRERGADIFRVHNVPANRDALAIVDAMSAAMAGEVW